MSSRMRKKRNQRVIYVRTKIPKIETQITGCSYGVHSWRFEDRGNGLWYKICTETKCGAVYVCTNLEIDWIKENNLA